MKKLKFDIGQLVFINDLRSLHHGFPRIVIAVKRRSYPYQLDDGFWYPENQLVAEPPVTAKLPPTPPSRWETYDIDSGLGIGGINNDQAAPFVPSAAAIERMQRLHDTDTRCRKCGASKNFDGAMFSTLRNVCDDCA